MSHILNLRDRLAGFSASRCPNIFTLMAILDRALGGSRARKLRTVLPVRALKGENTVETEVIYLVIMLTGAVSLRLDALKLEMQFIKDTDSREAVCGESRRCPRSDRHASRIWPRG